MGQPWEHGEGAIPGEVATHCKLKKAADGTSTQVATYMINKWMTKINGNEVYNIRGPLGMGDRKID